MSPSDKKKAIDIEYHVASRIRERRIMVGLTQQELADRVGITYQQLHKYERAINRISAGRLFEIARELNVHPSYFFEGLGDTPASPDLRQRMALELAKNAAQMDEHHLEALAAVTRALAAGGA
jgi:transcriptional regulator with XRE-family HTH domain